MDHSPTFHEVEAFVRDFARLGRKEVITPDTRLEADLGITGDDGGELLQKAAAHFGVQLADPVHGYRSTFGLGEHEFLFHDEGLDLLGIGVLIRRLRKQPEPRIRELTMGELHNAILRSKPDQ
jgi:hypothetical protein